MFTGRHHAGCFLNASAHSVRHASKQSEGSFAGQKWIEWRNILYIRVQPLIGNCALHYRTVRPGKALDHDCVYIVKLVATTLPHIGLGRLIGQSNNTGPPFLLGQIAISSDPRLANEVTRLLFGRDIDCVVICVHAPRACLRLRQTLDLSDPLVWP